MIDREQLRADAWRYEISLTDEMLEQFDLYARLLVEWNKRLNLTAITDPREICVKHFLDSLMVLRYLELPPGATVIDIGTGAGFPGIPMKILRGDIRLTLLDSLNKRISFLEAVSRELGQDNRCLHGRAEQMGRDVAHRERYQAATARAVAALPALCEYCLPFVEPGGVFLSMKGYDVETELSSAQDAIRLLGGGETAVHKLELPMGNRRSLVTVKKLSRISPKYPRISSKITKFPL